MSKSHRITALSLVSAIALWSLYPVLAFAQSAPVITSYAAQNQDTMLAITGTGFGSSAGTVDIDGITADINTWNPTEITVDLPANAGPGTITIDTSQNLSSQTPFSGVERGYYTLTPQGQVTAHGGISTYGDLTTLSTPASAPAIQLILAPDGQGYWILTQNGQVYNFGSAANLGSAPSGITAVAMAATPSGTGAWVLSSTGQVYALGQATNYGSAPSGTTAAAIASTPDGNGYWILAQDGTVYAFGDAVNYGSANVTIATPTSGTTQLGNGTLVQVDHAGPVFLVIGKTLYHVPSISILKAIGRTLGEVKHVSTLSGYTLGPPLVLPFADGSVIHVDNSTAYYLAQNGVLHAYASPAVMSASQVPASRVQNVPAIKLNWPVGSTISQPQPYSPNGALYRLQATKAVYILENGILHQIGSAAVFNAMGLKWSAIQNRSALPGDPTGSIITKPAPLLADGSLWRVQKAVYVAENGVLRHIPTAATFDQLGFSWSAIQNLPTLSGLTVGSPLDSISIPPGTPATTKAVDLVPTPSGLGYWILLADGTVDALGHAPSFGELTPKTLGSARAVSLAATPDGGGYTVLASNGASFSFGDALSGTNASSAVSLTMSPQPSASTVSATPTGFFSMAYGSFMPNYDGSYTTMVDNGAGLSAIIPTWYYEQQNPTTLAWTAGSPPTGFASVVSQAHAEGVQVWPMVGSTSVGPFVNAQAIDATVQQLVQDAVQNNYDGLTIDFEPSDFEGLSMAQASQQYTNFVAALGPALHAVGKKLMVDTYAAFYPASPYNLSAIAPYVDYINIMTYGHFDYTTEAGPDAGLGWMQSVYQSAIAAGVNPSQLIMGFGPYGDYWSFNNSGLDRNAPLGDDGYVSDAQVQQLLASNPNIVPVFDPEYGSEIFMTNEYVNSSGQWTVNPSGNAVAPTETLSTADESQMLPQVQNLQGLLNYILVRYAVDNNQPVPSYLNLAQDGHYGPLTADAVAQFQQDFDVTGATAGTYDAATQAALTQVIQQWNIGEYQYWVDTTQSMQNRVLSVALADKLGGMAVWRLPFETSDFWPTLESIASISHSQQGGQNS